MPLLAGAFLFPRGAGWKPAVLQDEILRYINFVNLHTCQVACIIDLSSLGRIDV